ALPGMDSRGAEPRTCIGRELAHAAIVCACLQLQPVCAFEMEADELVGLAYSIEVIGESFVQLRSLRLCGRSVDRLLYEDVTEAVRVFGCADEAASGERSQVALRRRRRFRVEQHGEVHDTEV